MSKTSINEFLGITKIAADPLAGFCKIVQKHADGSSGYFQEIRSRREFGKLYTAKNNKLLEAAFIQFISKNKKLLGMHYSEFVLADDIDEGLAEEIADETSPEDWEKGSLTAYQYCLVFFLQTRVSFYVGDAMNTLIKSGKELTVADVITMLSKEFKRL